MLLTPIPEKSIDYSQYAWYVIPFIYIYNYFLHAGISLTFAFLISGAIQEFIPQEKVIKYLGSGKKRNYIIAVLIAPLFITCSCSVVPVYAALLMAGAGVGVAMTFLLIAPAANFLTLWITGDYIGWDLVIWRYIFSAIAAIICGMLFAKTKTAREIEKKYEGVRIGRVQQSLEERDIHERIWSSYKYTWQMVKIILPFLLLGLFIVSFIAAYLPDELVEVLLVGYLGILVGAAVGGPLYTPTLVEVILTKELLDKGMDRCVALSFMMGQPYDVVSMFPNSKFFKWKGVALYTAIFFLFSIIAGVLYGWMYGELPLLW
ncbi:MAG: permease [Candidatus Hodarchaeota archaeon]